MNRSYTYGSENPTYFDIGPKTDVGTLLVGVVAHVKRVAPGLHWVGLVPAELVDEVGVCGAAVAHFNGLQLTAEIKSIALKCPISDFLQSLPCGRREIELVNEFDLYPLSWRGHDHPDALGVRWRNVRVIRRANLNYFYC